MKVIFCDVDGVLNNNETEERTPGGFRGISDALVEKLWKIADSCGAKIVISSDWRLLRYNPARKQDYDYLAEKLEAGGMPEISGHTDDISWKLRGTEIRKYLEDHPEITEYVILDDIPFADFADDELLPHLVLTDTRLGLSDEDVRKAVTILGDGSCQQ